jgi:hypothetical protein
MSTKRNRSGRSDNGGSSSSPGSSSSSGPSTRKPMVRRTYIERLLGKAEAMYSIGTDIAKMISGRGAPADIVTVAQEFVGVLEKYRRRFLALRDSGWLPPEPASKAEIKEGDAVSIAKKFLPKYDYIEGLAEGRTKLVAAKLTPKGGKGIDVLVKDAATNAPYGLIPKGHLIPA